MRAAVVALLLASCAGADLPGTRETFTNEGFSINVPEGWSTERDRGSIVFVSGHNTIAVHAVARSGEWVVERTPELVIPATARTLAALPSATVSAMKPLKSGDLIGAVFDVTYSPDAVHGARYQRRHAVLVGKERVFHIFVTAPQGELAKSAAWFEIAVKSLEEEG